jgi:hypothetical protein
MVLYSGRFADLKKLNIIPRKWKLILYELNDQKIHLAVFKILSVCSDMQYVCLRVFLVSKSDMRYVCLRVFLVSK